MRSVQLAPKCVSTEAGRAITLPRIVAGDQLATDGTAPLEGWDCDVLEAEGAARLRAVVHEIYQACAQLDPGEHLDSLDIIMNLIRRKCCSSDTRGARDALMSEIYYYTTLFSSIILSKFRHIYSTRQLSSLRM